MCPNSNCDWNKWDVPESVMDDYDAYVSNYDCELIDLFKHMED